MIPAKTFLLDIEGTTTPVDFVYQVLFPYARSHVRDFLERHWEDGAVRGDLALLQNESAADSQEWRESVDSVATYVHWLMDRDRKSTGLKALQGRIWEEGYQSGELRSQVYADVPKAFERWRRQGKDICIFSSGSVLAQKLLFANTDAGDLAPFIRDYFDTTIGAKKEAESYRRIAAALRQSPSEISFVSDLVAELDAARQAGMPAALCVRPGAPAPAVGAHPIIRTFDELG